MGATNLKCASEMLLNKKKGGCLISINHSVIPNSIRNLITKYSVDAETSSA